MNQKKNKGITLIALVITIIILLILAGISIANLTGSGLFGKAKEAKEKTNEAEVKEKIQLVIMASYDIDGKINLNELNNNLQNIEGLKTKLPIKSLPHTIEIDEYKIKIETTGTIKIVNYPNAGTIITGKNLEYEENGTAIIPVGFCIVPGCEDVSEGLVISDNPQDTEIDPNNIIAEGNQFVWVPVTDINDFHTVEGYTNGNRQNVRKESYNYSEPYIDGYSTETEEYEAMKQSVILNKGFYIGRYETSKENEQVLVKKNKKVHNQVTWGNSKNMTVGTGGVAESSKEFANLKGYSSVKSTLCYGVQWDATMQFFDKNYINGNCGETSYVRNSSQKGNYNNSELINTGSNEEYKEKNIYDMAGNASEWVMEGENRDGGCRFFRGGSCTSNGNEKPASFRASDYPDSTAYDFGYRIALYIK